MILNIILFILILGFIVLVHEGGHFFFAKMTGVHVYEFSIGMGPVLFKKIAKDKTQYSIRAFPIGGFVSLAGEEVDDEKRKATKGHNLQDKTVFQRFLVMFAGVFNNFVSAFIILVIVGLLIGSPSTKPVISGVEKGFPAEEAGIEQGDIVKRINKHKITYLEDISLYLAIEDLSKPVKIEVQKNNGAIETYKLKAKEVKEKDGKKRYALGVMLEAKKEGGFFNSFKYAFNEGCAILKQMYVVIINLFTGGVHLNQLAGPVGIYSIVGQMSKSGIAALLYLTALLSINVAVINLLPFPAFDGGRILFLIIEKIKGKPVDPKIENIIHSIGFVLLMLLMIYVTFNDVLKLF